MCRGSLWHKQKFETYIETVVLFLLEQIHYLYYMQVGKVTFMGRNYMTV